MKNFVIEHPSELNIISALPVKRTAGLGRIRLGGSIAEHPKREGWEMQLNSGYFACGCDTAAKGLLLGIAVGIVWNGSSFWTRETSIWPLLLGTVGIALAGAIAGKIYGLYKAETKLRSVVIDIQEHWKIDRPDETVQILCG